MIDLTPLDVRKKKGDFSRAMRGYDPARVDEFLDLVAERMEELVRENGALATRVESLTDSVAEYRDRERALNDALVSAQQIREDMREQAQREAELHLREARGEADRLLEEAKRQVAMAAEAVRRLQGQRARFLRLFRALVERQLAEIEQEEDRAREFARTDGDAPGTRAISAGGSRVVPGTPADEDAEQEEG